jgi:predicted nucleotidyltransferase
VGDPAQGLGRLRAAASDGTLDMACARHSVRVLTVFGSTAQGAPKPADLDVAVAFQPGVTPDVLALLEELVSLTGVEQVDLLNLDRAGPVARERGLVGAIPLYESEPGAYATTQMAAMTTRMETERFRRMSLELMAG